MSKKFKVEEAGSMQDCKDELSKWLYKWMAVPYDYKIRSIVSSTEGENQMQIEIRFNEPKEKVKMGSKRFGVFVDNHFGFGIRWLTECTYPLELSFAFPFFSVTVGFGKARW